MNTEAARILTQTDIGTLVNLLTQVTGGSVEEHVLRSQIHRLREEAQGPVIHSQGVVERVFYRVRDAD